MKSFFFALLLSASIAHAEPLLRVDRGNIHVVLYSESCALPAVVNLPLRAEWVEKGKTFVGCWDLNTFGVIVMYFDDKTAVSIPIQFFTQVQGV